MKKFFFACSIMLGCQIVNAQTATDTTVLPGGAVIIKDARITTLEEKLGDYNAANAKAAATASTVDKAKEQVATSVSGIVLGAGYRLMVISTTDRELAMKVRSQLFQSFGEHKQYMSFQMPNTKIKLGNFVDRGAAEKVKKRIMGMKLVTNNIYILPDTIEIKVEKKVMVDGEEDKKDEKKKK
jgi:hypothetical protein